MLAIRLHPLVTSRWHRHRNPQLARRPLPIPLACTAYAASPKTRRRDQLHRNRSHLRPARIHPHRQRNRIHRHDSPTATTTSNAYSPPWASPRKTVAPAIPRPKAKSNGSTRPSNAGSAGAPPLHHRRHYNNSSTNSPHLQHPTHTPSPTTPRHTSAAPTTPAPKPTPPTSRRTLPIRHDTIDQFGKLTLRYGSRIHHLGTGKRHARTPVLILATTTTVTVISKKTYHLILQPHLRPRHATTGATNKNTPADGRGDL